MATVQATYQMGLRRANLSETVTTHQDWARDYLNAIIKEIEGEATWWWKFKTGTITTVASTRTYSLASDTLSLVGVFDTSNNRHLHIEGPRFAQSLDPDLSETGDPRVIYPLGLDSSGYMQAGLYPTPSATSDSITYQYYGYTPDFTSADDSTSLDTYIHPSVQPALYFGVARLLRQQEGDDEGAVIEEAEFQKVMARARRQNIDVMGDHRARRDLPPKTSTGFNFIPREGSLS